MHTRVAAVLGTARTAVDTVRTALLVAAAGTLVMTVMSGRARFSAGKTLHRLYPSRESGVYQADA